MKQRRLLAIQMKKIANALAHPLKDRILECILSFEKTGTRASVTDMCTYIPDVDQSVISQHIKPMRLLGLVVFEKVGRNNYYSTTKLFRDFVNRSSEILINR